MLVNCFMIYRKDEDGTIHNMQPVPTEKDAQSHVDGLTKSAKMFGFTCTYYYEPYQFDIDPEILGKYDEEV